MISIQTKTIGTPQSFQMNICSEWRIIDVNWKTWNENFCNIKIKSCKLFNSEQIKIIKYSQISHKATKIATLSYKLATSRPLKFICLLKSLLQNSFSSNKKSLLSAWQKFIANFISVRSYLLISLLNKQLLSGLNDDKLVENLEKNHH